MLGSGGTLLGLRTQRTDPPDVLVNMMEVGEETRQECNSMKENLMCPEHAGNPFAQVVPGRLHHQ